MSNSPLKWNPFCPERIVRAVEEMCFFEDVHVTLDGHIAVSLKERWWDEFEDSELFVTGSTNRFYSRAGYTICRRCNGCGVEKPDRPFASSSICRECEGERVHLKVNVVSDEIWDWLLEWAEFEAHASYEDGYLRSRGY